MSIDTALKDYILTTKTVADIIIDFQALFPKFVSYSDDILEVYIDTAFYILPRWIVNVGFNSSYKTYLYALAHLLVSQDVQADGTTSSDDDRLSNNMSADGVSIGYRNLGNQGTMSEWEYFFGNTNYGKMVLLFLKANGIDASKGAYVV